MSRLFAGTAAAAWTAAAWTLAVAFWRGTGRVPSPLELTAGLAGLPALGLAIGWTMFRMRSRNQDLQAAELLPVDAPLNIENNNRPFVENRWQPVLAAGVLRTVLGQHAAEVCDTLISAKSLVPLDTHLKDSNGFPLLAGRIAALDGSDCLSKMTAWTAARSPENDLQPEEVRTLVLLQQIAEDIAAVIACHTGLAEYRTMATKAQQQFTFPMLYPVIVLPESMKVCEHCAADLAVEVFIRNGWPPERLAVSRHELGPEQNPLALIDTLLPLVQQQPHEALFVVLAAASFIGEATVRAWEADGQLFSADRDTGCIPGEGAAGLLLTLPEQAAFLPDAAAVRLHRVAMVRRKQSADTAARINAESAIRVCREAMTQAGIPEGVTLQLICDADHRASRTGELAQAANEAMPDFDPVMALRIEAGCGTLGPAASIMTLVLARETALSTDAAALCLSLQDPWQRSAVVLTPTHTKSPSPGKVLDTPMPVA